MNLIFEKYLDENFIFYKPTKCLCCDFEFYILDHNLNREFITYNYEFIKLNFLVNCPMCDDVRIIDETDKMFSL